MSAATYCNDVLMLLDSKRFAFQARVQVLLDLQQKTRDHPGSSISSTGLNQLTCWCAAEFMASKVAWQKNVSTSICRTGLAVVLCMRGLQGCSSVLVAHGLSLLCAGTISARHTRGWICAWGDPD